MVNEYETKDSGAREQFPTGYQRDTREGKGRMDLLPVFMLERLAKLYERGAVKYGDRNFQKGAPFSRMLDSAFRHLLKYMQGMRDEDHATAIIWNMAQIIEQEELIGRGLLPAELDDMPKYEASK